MLIEPPKTEIQSIDWHGFEGLNIHIKRDDLIDDKISGNKLYKLYRNIEFAEQNRFKTIITFGGAFSNHIAATASICKKRKLSSIGIIRGEADSKTNPTLSFAESCGMELKFISREDYKCKSEPSFTSELKLLHPNSFIIPEGGANQLGIEGAMNILDARTSKYDYVVCAMGTGTTYAGLVKAAPNSQSVIGIPIHKHENLLNDIIELEEDFQLKPNDQILNGHHLGGYAKWTPELLQFIRSFFHKTTIKLDPIYTGKAMFAIDRLSNNDFFPKGSNVLFIHTGGIQGVAGFEDRFRLKLFE